MQRLLKIVLTAIASVISFPAISDSDQQFRFTEKLGSYAVGLKVIDQYDYSRVYRRAYDDLGKPDKGERARPIQTLIWYPAASGGAKHMTIEDYGMLLASETNFGGAELTDRLKDKLSGMGAALKSSMWASRDIEPATGHFPVVIYAPSFSSTSWENADLCEYLASHGYVVIASADQGEKARAMTNDLAGVTAQARDISFLIGYAKTLPYVDQEEIAVAGYSWGGLSNLFAAAHDNRIDALVALDGSMRYWSGLIKQAGDIHLEEMAIPLIYFEQGFTSLENLVKLPHNDGPVVLNAWTHGDLVRVHMDGLIHQEFSSMFQRDKNMWDMFGKDLGNDYSREDGAPGYGWMARYTLAFLDSYLKHDERAKAFLKRSPGENGVPKHVLTVTFRAASGLPLSFESFRREIGRRGFDHADEIFKDMQAENPDFRIEEDDFNAWSEKLIDANHLPEAISILKLNVSIHPKSSDASVSLGDVYRKVKQRQLAIDSYQEAIKRNPNNVVARRRLDETE